MRLAICRWSARINHVIIPGKQLAGVELSSQVGYNFDSWRSKYGGELWARSAALFSRYEAVLVAVDLQNKRVLLNSPVLQIFTSHKAPCSAPFACYAAFYNTSL